MNIQRIRGKIKDLELAHIMYDLQKKEMEVKQK
jgi:hypothetical protein